MRVCRCVGLAIFVLFILSVFTPGLERVAFWLSGPSELGPADAIVVLATGGVHPRMAISTESLRRTLYGVALHRQRLARLLLLSGWPGEVDRRAEIAGKLGVPPTAVLTESRAHTTRDEAVLVRDQLGSLGVRRVLLVVDVASVPRARGAFERVGFTVLAAPLDHGEISTPEARLTLLRQMLVEWIAWSYYRLAGYV